MTRRTTSRTCVPLACAGIALTLVLLFAVPGPLAARCRQALVLGLDVSGSVNGREYRLQLDGLAAALSDADVRQALLAQPSAPVTLAVFEWSGPDYQRVIQEWTPVTSAETLAAISTRLVSTARVPAPPGTALGSAMQFGASLLQQQPECWKRTLDISGDGRQNLGPHPRDVRNVLVGKDLTLNALAIGADAPRGDDLRQEEIAALSSYFQALVITGPGAFVETAVGFEDYRAAMTRKLKRELEGLVLSSLPDASTRPLHQ